MNLTERSAPCWEAYPPTLTIAQTCSLLDLSPVEVLRLARSPELDLQVVRAGMRHLDAERVRAWFEHELPQSSAEGQS